MTKSEYMEALQKKLECFNRQLQQEIVEDYERHFAEGIAAGKTEEEIVADLGSIEDMIRELPEEDMKQEIRSLEDASQSNTYTGEYKAVVIDGEIANVNLEQSDDGQIHVEYQNNGSELMQQKYRYYQYEEAGIFYAGVRKDESASEKEAKRAVKIMLFGKKLDIDLDNPFDLEKTFHNIWSGDNGDIQLNIRIPAGMPRVTVKTVSGDINARNVTPVQLEMRSTSGDMEARHMTVDRLKLKTASGNITATQIYSADTDAQTASGNLRLDNADVGTLCFQGASGNFSGRLVRGNAVNIGTGSGNVELDGNFERYSIRTGSGNTNIRAEADAKQVRVGTGSGDVKLDLTAVAGTEVTVTTGSGNARIYSSGNVRHQVTRGTCTVGDGDCKVDVTTGSGNAEVRCR